MCVCGFLRQIFWSVLTYLKCVHKDAHQSISQIFGIAVTPPFTGRRPQAYTQYGHETVFFQEFLILLFFLGAGMVCSAWCAMGQTTQQNNGHAAVHGGDGPKPHTEDCHEHICSASFSEGCRSNDGRYGHDKSAPEILWVWACKWKELFVYLGLKCRVN